MWIFMNDSMLSIVEDFGDPEQFVVRARIKGDIENVFPDAVVEDKIGTDYKFRTFLPRQVVVDAITKRLNNIDYFNFKSSVDIYDYERSNAYHDVWASMLRYQYQNDTDRERNPKYAKYFGKQPKRSQEYYDSVFKMGKTKRS